MSTTAIETEQQTRPVVPPKTVEGDYPLIDNDPHFKRVIRYARTSDLAWWAGIATATPTAFYLMERVSPFPGVAKDAWKGPFKSSIWLGFIGGFYMMYSRSCNRFFGFTENRRELEMDMREMTDRVKRGEPIYGHSRLSTHMQGVAARQTRYSSLNLAIMPWFNFVNHPHHGVDTAKYYINAERELEAEREGGRKI